MVQLEPQTSTQGTILAENDTQVVYVYRKEPFVDKEFGSIDHLVMTCVLLISLGLSLSRTLTDRKKSKKERELPTASEDSNSTSSSDVFYKTLAAAGTTTSPFINTLCLFGLTGEIYRYNTAVVFFLFGVILSIIFLLATQYFTIIGNNVVSSFPSYLRKRFQRKGIFGIVAFCSILRHFVGGALNLCIMGIGVSAMTDLSALMTSIIITSAAVFCSTMSRIQSGNNSSIGGILIWLVGLTSIITLTVTTINEGGFLLLFQKAFDAGKIRVPKFTVFPWIKGTFWGFLSIGMVVGFQIFAFSRSTLRHASTLPKKAFYGSIAVTFMLMFIWTFIGFWGGICVSVVFEGTEVSYPDGLMAKLVSREMKDMKGFRGFFVSTLFAASISGLTRRFNQLIELIWETALDTFVSEKERERNRYLKNSSNVLPDDLLKEMKWEERKRTCLAEFAFKLMLGVATGGLSLGIVYAFLGLNMTVWELWHSVIGIFTGPMVAAMIIGLFFPCISHMSVCLGLVIGWALPCYLMIGNKIPDFTPVTIRPTEPPSSSQLENIFVPPEDSPVRLLNRTLVEKVFIFYNEEQTKDQFLETTVEKDRRKLKASSEDKKNKRWFNKIVRSKVLSTCYCYYAPIGMCTCIFSSILFAMISGKCNNKLSPQALQFLHPHSRRYYLRYSSTQEEDDPEEDADLHDRPDPRNRKKINALKFLQETANI